MDTVERLNAPTSERASGDPVIGAPAYKDNAITPRLTAAGDSFSWAMHEARSASGIAPAEVHKSEKVDAISKPV
jgi:hypothetical protein